MPAADETVPPVRVVALLPTFDNACTLPGVIDGVMATGLPMIVVDDGATDATADVLTRFADRIRVIRHDVNRGKAAALRTGFAFAFAAGYTHAVTIDTDAQHDPADLPPLVALANQTPDALILGVRSTDVAGYPKANRLGRWAANTLVRWQGGPRITDSQCGLRVYPLAAVTRLRVRSPRYGYETEILTRAAWAGVPIVEAPVRCVYAVAGGRVSHYRPWVDTGRAAALHVRLLGEALLRWLNPRPAWRAARRDPRDRRRLAAALSVGVFIANLPLYGLQTVISVFVARRLKLQPLAVLAGSHVSTPPVGPALIAFAIGLGHWLLHGRFAAASEYDPRRVGYVECLRRVALEWTLGGVVCGAALATATFVVGMLVLRVGAKEHSTQSAEALTSVRGSTGLSEQGYLR